MKCKSCNGTGELPEILHGVALFGGGTLCIRCDGSGRTQAQGCEAPGRQGIHSRDCHACGGQGWGDGFAETRRDGREGDTTCTYCDGTGREGGAA